LTPSGFFVLRTPILPFDALQSWSRDGADRDALQSLLWSTWRQPVVREAVFLASPELDAALARADAAAEAGGAGDAAQRALRSFAAYFARMCARATPFGLFAGCSVGTFGRFSQLTLPARHDYQRHTRLDMDYLSTLVVALQADAEVRRELRFLPNSSLYPAGGRLHYVESRMGQQGRTYHLVAVDETPEVTRTLGHATDRCILEDLAQALVADDVSYTEAREFIDELAASQILVSELELDVTGAEPIHGMIARLAANAPAQPVATCLANVRDALSEIDHRPVGGNTNEQYIAIQSTLAELPATPELARLFQVDLVKPSTSLTLAPVVVGEVARGLGLLQRLAPPRRSQSTLDVFRERFVERYEGAEVPLMEVLDEELGIGFAASAEPGGEPLLQKLDLPAPADEPAAWYPRHATLLQLLSDALADNRQELVLQAADVEALATSELEATPLPQALDVVARVAAQSAGAVDRGEFRIWIRSASGPSGARLLGRFCHADPELHRYVEDHLRAEEALRPDAVFAEIVHLPEGRIGNILCRPVLRAFEIPFLGGSGATADRQIAITDLRVSVRAGRVVLRSARLDREVMPRLTTAHNFSLRSLGVYRFLCGLQFQDVGQSFGWSWGPLETAPFLPRVRHGRIVLARARWNLTRSEIQSITEATGPSQFQSLQHLRVARRLPRYVALADGDNELVVDLDNVVSVEAFLHLVRGRVGARLEELFPPPDELCVVGPEGRFVHELVIPFVSERAPARAVAPSTFHPAATASTRHQRPDIKRVFPPGSEWLYLKLYTGHGLADRLLTGTVHPLVERAFAESLADSWFFLRYADPRPHLRVRIHGDPRTLSGELLPVVAAALAPLVDDGRLALWQVDTYVREVERYGGETEIGLAEEIFRIDSDCVMRILRSSPGDEGLEWRWRLGICGVDLLLDAFGLSLSEKCSWARLQRDTFAREFRVDGRQKQQLGAVFRDERDTLAELLRIARTPLATSEYPAIAALQDRGAALIAPVSQLSRSQSGARLPTLAASYAHMHLNRLLRSAHRFQELAIYELLDRIYRSEGVRRAPGDDGDRP
jgi:thiopeptide-type bacteriocin biosynthesis protein